MNCFFQKTTLFRFSCFSPLKNVIKNTRNFSISTQQYNHSRDRDANGESYSTTHSTGSLKQLQQLQFGKKKKKSIKKKKNSQKNNTNRKKIIQQSKYPSHIV